MHQWLGVFGTALGLIGGWLLASILIMSDKQAIEAGVPRFAGDTDDVNIKLPMVQLFVQQSRRTILGMGIISVGSVFQIINNWPTR